MTHSDGCSERVVDYIGAVEKEKAEQNDTEEESQPGVAAKEAAAPVLFYEEE
jgi:hypothetical protein